MSPSFRRALSKLFRSVKHKSKKNRPQPNYRPQLEYLEARLAPAQLFWDANHSIANLAAHTTAGNGGGSGTFETGTNWWNGVADVAWVNGSDAVFDGTV